MPDTAEAAPCVLGHHLLAIERKYLQHKPVPANSGSTAIDEKALVGGFRYGEITSIAGASGTGKTLITYHAITSHLLATKCSEVALIDTTGSFSPFRLRDILVYRLEARSQHERYQESGYVYEKVNATEDFVEEANSMLDRVKVMRVFDLAGVIEAVGEVTEVIEQRAQDTTNAVRPGNLTRTGEVGDSEEDANDDDQSSNDNHPSNAQTEARSDNSQIGMLIIDTIANAISPVLAKSQLQGQALLSSFMRSLGHLTARRHVCTLLINTAVGTNPSDNSGYRLPPAENASVFASTMGKPALGRTYTHLVDTSIFLSVVPKTSRDATIAIGEGSDAFQKALVLEVLKDRCGNREGRWASFEIVSGIKLVPYPR